MRRLYNSRMLEAALHISTIQNELEARRDRNPHYSLRAYSRDLGLDPSTLSLLLRRKKGVSEKRACEIAIRLGLTDREREGFVLSALMHHGRSPAKRARARERIKNEYQKRSIRSIRHSEFAQARNWYHLAILNLVELKACTHTLEWFAKRLRLSVPVVDVAVARLLKLDLLRIENGRYIATQQETTVDQDIPSVAIKKFHQEILDKAEAALHFSPVEAREFQSLTLAFSTSEMAEAKSAIRNFLRDFSQRFYNPETEMDSVHQLSIQLFRLDQKQEPQL